MSVIRVIILLMGLASITGATAFLILLIQDFRDEQRKEDEG